MVHQSGKITLYKFDGNTFVAGKFKFNEIIYLFLHINILIYM